MTKPPSKVDKWMCTRFFIVISFHSAKLKAQKMSAVSDGEEESGNILEQLKRKRDYRRRRQAYRAKNVHITKRTPKEVICCFYGDVSVTSTQVKDTWWCVFLYSAVYTIWATSLLPSPLTILRGYDTVMIRHV